MQWQNLQLVVLMQRSQFCWKEIVQALCALQLMAALL